uniref:non-specific serine/threonine protein kinase n=1 Tax=Cannabis sativa TaxID=3483 RepID=A0A803NVU6_CANSA
MNNSQFVQEKSCKILTSIVSARQKIINGETSNLKKTSPNTNDVLKCLVNWLCAEKPLPSNLSRSSPTAISCLATLLKEPVVKAFFVHSNGVRLLVPFINPPFIQPSIQLVYETCFCVWLLSYYEPAIEHLATSKALPRLMDVAKNSTAEKVVRVVIMTFQYMLAKGIFDSQMIQLDLSELVQSLKIQIWSDEDLLDALNQVDENLNKIKALKSFEIYKQEVLLGRLYWTSIRKDSAFWSNNIAHFEENNFQILRVLITILDTSCDPRALAVACFDLSQFIKHHIDGRFIVTKLNAKERVMKLLDHKNDEVTKNALLCTQRLLLGRKDTNGAIIEARCSSKSGNSSLETVEVLGIKETLSWIKGKTWSKVVIESDCLVAVQAIHTKVVLPSLLAAWKQATTLGSVPSGKVDNDTSNAKPHHNPSAKLVKAFGNIPGVDIVRVERLTLLKHVPNSRLRSGLNLSGTLSPSICNLPHLIELNVSINFISGPIPKNLASCHNLQILDFCTNRFHGELLTPISELTSLKKLYLCENYMYGEMPEEIGNLTLLEELVIYSNNLTGSIPASISKLKKLKIIRAGKNFLSGPLPPEISECESLEVLGLSQNMLEGALPGDLHKLQNLTDLILWQNRFSGSIPPEIGNLRSLELLALHENSFSGTVPEELGRLSKLKRLYIYTNQLNGTIPNSLGNCTNAVEIDLSENQLRGFIPRQLGYLSKLRLLHLFENRLQGSIPQEFGKLKNLQNIDLSINNLTGRIPLEFQNLTLLVDLQLFDNHLEGKIPPHLGLNSNLTILDMSANNLVGNIPPHLCKYQTLMFLSLGSNRLSGNIPYGLKTCKSLMQLMLGDNHLTGSLPLELYKLHNLSALELFRNRFSGPILPEVGKLMKLERLLLANNYFVGNIPPEIGNLVHLVAFNISSNRLSGHIPHEVGNCVKLQRLDLSSNMFTSSLPAEIGELVNMELLKLSDNKFTGEIPSTLGQLSRLTELQMGGNQFSGNIPLELGQLSSLQIALNISHNNLSGPIPERLGNLQMLESLFLNDNKLDGEIPSSIGDLPSLMVCNLSNNNLVGAVPNSPAFRRMDSTNFAGNKDLSRLDSNDHDTSATQSLTQKQSGTKKGSTKAKLVIIITVVAGLIFIFLIMGLFWAINGNHPTFLSIEEQPKPDVFDDYYFPKEGFSYQDLVEATSNFSESTILGRGACGTVYKAVMINEVIAVKKLKSRGEGASADSSFRAEISTLGKIRHRNIVKLHGFCYHQDNNLLLYEYMANGSLGEQLHGNEQTCLLDWNARYKIALGAAEGLCYLHCDCKPQIIHRDIKSNNILLDEFLQAHVGDFGLAKLIDFPYSKSMSMSAVAGSYGYIAPEYAYTMKVTEKCDIYSFGVVLLELVTGRSPVQPLEQGGDLVNWVRRAIKNAVPAYDLFDKRLGLDLNEQTTVDEMTLFLKIALFCTSSSPVNRPTMKEVIAMMFEARKTVSKDSFSASSEAPLAEDASSKGIMEL